MKRNPPSFHGKVMVAIMLSIILVGLAACGKAPPTQPARNQDNLAFVQGNKYLTARLYGLMAFDFNGTAVTFPTELAIASVPIDWMGQIFTGKLEEAGPGEDLTDQVHGSVSADGTWLLTLSYSRQTTRTVGNAVSYSVKLKNVPIGRITVGGTTEPGSFEKEGDVQKYVEDVEYVDGLLVGGKIVPGTTYISTDWANSSKGLQPILRLKFERIASQKMGPLPTQSGMMGQP